MLTNMADCATSDSRVEKYCKLFFKRYIFQVAVTDLPESGDKLSENMGVNSQLTANMLGVATQKFQDPHFTGESRRVVGFFHID